MPHERQAASEVIAAVTAQELELDAKPVCDVQHLSFLQEVEERLRLAGLVAASGELLDQRSLAGEALRALTDMPPGLREMLKEPRAIHG